MADESSEKTEEPTPKRQKESKEKGQVPRSRELTTLVMMLTASAGLMVVGKYIYQALENVFHLSWQPQRHMLQDPAWLVQATGLALKQMVMGLLPFLLMMVAAAIIGSAMLGGLNFSQKALGFKVSKMNPMKGLAKMFGLKALVELGKSLAKFSIVALVAWFLLQNTIDDFARLAGIPLDLAIPRAMEILGWSLLKLSSTLILIAVIDVPYQLWDNSRQLKMSLQEIKDEMKDSEGKPEVKGRIRQLQREMSQRRMMADVPEADVIITNPTHYSVALKYKHGEMDAPIVVASGVDHVALKIREIAKEYEVIMVTAPPLARAIYYSSEVGEPINEGLYLSIAQVLAYVYQLNEFQKGQATQPEMPGEFDIPTDLQREK
ncbi:flagellar biosynthesis protein FlhB [Pelagibaculum spongiae]|uniref:Flagellar biosynthetic protein FlhB n=1 Tax=Pelagibaculum spongiae TaxID=2080658 RepID=A0A2V1GTW4_9GAMM|nr:flagellar biosynthesis protein FlhB [Pelagibaculum spongiae]PVZ66711.1 flagellar biosynthesis protein FlhB [Pelagibaculum spongiae]